jgi:hypothetical protein
MMFAPEGVLRSCFAWCGASVDRINLIKKRKYPAKYIYLLDIKRKMTVFQAVNATPSRSGGGEKTALG